jgi:hypothetical protein
MSEDLAQDIIRTTIIGIVLFVGVAIAAFMWLMVEVNAHEGWDHIDPETKQWYSDLRQPDSPSTPCCGTADAYYCDILGTEAVKNEGGTRVSNFCLITDDREDWPLLRPHIDIGTKIYIPNNKMKWSKDDPQTGIERNPTGHNVIFLSREKFVYCFVMAGGV